MVNYAPLSYGSKTVLFDTSLQSYGAKAPLYLAIAGHEAAGKRIGGWEPAAPQGE
jgi:hypothetical protein